MESLLGFKETTASLHDNRKLVPWLNWDEWDFVRDYLFSSSPDSITKSINRIAAWRSRGCLPVVIEVTASIIEIHQRDPYFRVGVGNEASDSEEMLAMLYTMAIMRLVNGVIEKTRKKTEISIAEAAAAIDMPRMLIDIRHEGSHRDLPSLRLLRLASIKALNWLKSYYWDPQKKAIPYQGGKCANVRKEIRSRLRELAFSLKVKQSSRSSSSRARGKGGKHNEQLISAPVSGRNKFFSVMTSKSQTSKYIGSKKQITRALKNLVRLYSFFSSDVVSVLLDFLLKASNSTETVDSPDNFQVNLSIDVSQAVFDEWKPVLAMFSKKEPELLLSLLKAVLDMIESRKAIRYDLGGEFVSLLQYDLETQRVGVLSSLFTWLVLILEALKAPNDEGQDSPVEASCALPKPMLIELIRRCLHVSEPENHELLSSALLLAKMVGSSHLNEKLHKLSLLTSFKPRSTEDNRSDVDAEDLILHEKYIRQAAEKLELVRLSKTNNASALRTQHDNAEGTNIWIIAKSWNPCPLGMLPRAVGSSGCLPVLDCSADNEQHKGSSNPINGVEFSELRPCSRKAASDIQMMKNSSSNSIRDEQNIDFSEPDDMNVITASDGIKGRLLIGGVWQKVGDHEIQDIKSRVTILVTRREI